jgi:hypothetical protein
MVAILFLCACTFFGLLVEPGWQLWVPKELHHRVRKKDTRNGGGHAHTSTAKQKDDIHEKGFVGTGGGHAQGPAATPKEDAGTSTYHTPTSLMARVSAPVASTLAAVRSRGLLQAASSSSSVGILSFGSVLVLFAASFWRRSACTMPADAVAEVAADVTAAVPQLTQQPMSLSDDIRIVVMFGACLFLVGVVVGLIVGVVVSLEKRRESLRSQNIHPPGTGIGESRAMIGPKTPEKSEVVHIPSVADSDLEPYYIGTPTRQLSCQPENHANLEAIASAG